MSERVTVFFDYLCPFAWRGAEVAEMVAEPLGLHFEWHHFSLVQSNYGRDNGWQLWNEKIDDADESGGKGLLPFLASCAARRQGREKHDRFRLELLRARHQHNRSLTRRAILQVAEGAGLHMPTFLSDLANPECRTLLAQEHHQAVALDVFGTPTFHFSSGHIAYLRIRELPLDSEEAVRLFSDYRRLLECYPYLETVKRPRCRCN